MLFGSILWHPQKMDKISSTHQTPFPLATTVGMWFERYQQWWDNWDSLKCPAILRYVVWDTFCLALFQILKKEVQCFNIWASKPPHTIYNHPQKWPKFRGPLLFFVDIVKVCVLSLITVSVNVFQFGDITREFHFVYLFSFSFRW